jgi:hypothetical protein
MNAKYGGRVSDRLHIVYRSNERFSTKVGTAGNLYGLSCLANLILVRMDPLWLIDEKGSLNNMNRLRVDYRSH